MNIKILIKKKKKKMSGGDTEFDDVRDSIGAPPPSKRVRRPSVRLTDASDAPRRSLPPSHVSSPAPSSLAASSASTSEIESLPFPNAHVSSNISLNASSNDSPNVSSIASASADGGTLLAPAEDEVKAEDRVDAVVERAVVVGSVAVPLGVGERSAASQNTHRWSVYVRALHGHNLAFWLKSATFALHESFARPVRRISAAPFEVTERGWGEFDVHVTLQLHDPRERPIELVHTLRIHPPAGTSVEADPTAAADAPVVSETVFDLTFERPSAAFYALLMRDGQTGPARGAGSVLRRVSNLAAQPELADEQRRVLNALLRVRAQILRCEADFLAMHVRSNELRAEIARELHSDTTSDSTTAARSTGGSIFPPSFFAAIGEQQF